MQYRRYLVMVPTFVTNIGEIHYHTHNKTNGGKQIEFSAESNQFEKKIKRGNK